MYQRIAKDPITCGIKRLIVLSTERFDFNFFFHDVRNETFKPLASSSYFHLIKQLKDQGKIIWLANNPYEAAYAERKLGISLNYTLVRPFGFSSVPPDDNVKDKNDKVVLLETRGIEFFFLFS